MMTFNNFQNHAHKGHDEVVNFFRLHSFGSNRPVLTYLSILAPVDRCIILEQLHNTDILDSILNDKLLLAYVTSGRIDLAKEVIRHAVQMGETEMNLYGLNDKLDLPPAPNRSGAERIAIYEDFLSSSDDAIANEFLNIVINFCREYY